MNTHTTLFILLAITHSLKVSDFKQGIFTKGQPYGFWQVQTIPKNNNGQINLAYADFNGDKFTDIVVSDSSLQRLSIYFWNHQQSQFIISELPLDGSAGNIVSVLPSDYNFDGSMDLLVVFTKSQYQIQIYYGNNCEDNQCIFTQSSKSKFVELDTVQPFLIDPTGNGIPSIVIVRNNTRKVLTTDGQNYEERYFSYLIEGSVSFPILTNHMAANVDFTGDCFSDLVLLSGNSTQFIEFYEYLPNSSKYRLSSQYSIPLKDKVEGLRFADVNSDGVVDIVMMYSNGSVTQPKVIYGSRDSINICSGSSKFPYDFQKTTELSFTGQFVQKSNLLLADVNIDGYPDILTTRKNEDGGTSAYLYINVFCEECPEPKRSFQESSAFEKIKSLKSVDSASFFDLAEDGTLDIVLNTDQNGNYSLTTFVNNLKEDSFFIKALPLSSYSSEDDGRLINVFGATFQWRITTLEGDPKIAYANQLSQQTHRSLSLPFISTGLGRTNNYIQDFTVGYLGGKNVSAWTPIIPNSRLIVEPDGRDWQLGVYVNPDTKIRDVIIITIIILILIGVVILCLIRKEVIQDRNNPLMFFQLIR